MRREEFKSNLAKINAAICIHILSKVLTITADVLEDFHFDAFGSIVTDTNKQKLLEDFDLVKCIGDNYLIPPYFFVMPKWWLIKQHNHPIR